MFSFLFRPPISLSTHGNRVGHHTACLFLILLPLFCIEAKSATPGAGHSDPRPILNLQERVTTAIAEGSDVLRLPAGEFTIEGDVKIAGAKNLTIQGEATVLYFAPDSDYITASGSTNIVIKNIVVDSDPLPFTQGTVVSIAPDKKSFEYRIHDGYPKLKPGMKNGSSGAFVFDPQTREWRPDVPDISVRKSEILDENSGRIVHGGTHAGYNLIRLGDLVAFKNPASNALRFMGCDGVRLEDVTVRSSGLGAYILRSCEGEIRLSRCKIERGPKPPGATEARLISTNADGLNLGYCREGVIMEDCDFSWMGDDSVNLHGSIQRIVAAEPGNILWTASEGFPEYMLRIKKDDIVHVLAKGSYARKDAAPIIEASRQAPSAEIEAAARNQLNFAPDRRLFFVRLQLASAVDASAGEFIDVPATACPGFVIRNNYFHDHRARGLRLGASKGIIENNRFERIKSCAISLGPHAIHGEGGWVSDIVVRGNQINRVAFDDRGYEPTSYNQGAITVQHFLQKGIDYPQENTGIVVENNRITDVGGPGIMFTSAKHGVVRGNVISGAQQRDCSEAGVAINLRAIGAISINHSSDILVEQNQVLNPGPFAGPDVSIYPVATVR